MKDAFYVTAEAQEFVQENEEPDLEFAAGTAAEISFNDKHEWITLNGIDQATEQVFVVDASDLDGDALTYNWKVNGETPGLKDMQLSRRPTGEAVVKLKLYSPVKDKTKNQIKGMSAEERHKVVVELTVSDGMALARAERTLFVNEEPELDFAAGTAAEISFNDKHEWITLNGIDQATEQVFVVDASDLDGDALTYNWKVNGETPGLKDMQLSRRPTGEAVVKLKLYSPVKDKTKNQIKGMSAEERHKVVVELTVSDGMALARAERTLFVNEEPELDFAAGTAAEISFNDKHEWITLNGIDQATEQVFVVDASDLDGDALTYNWKVNGETPGLKDMQLSRRPTGEAVVKLKLYSPVKDKTKNQIKGMSAEERHKVVVELTVSDGMALARAERTLFVNVRPTVPEITPYFSHCSSPKLNQSTGQLEEECELEVGESEDPDGDQIIRFEWQISIGQNSGYYYPWKEANQQNSKKVTVDLPSGYDIFVIGRQIDEHGGEGDGTIHWGNSKKVTVDLPEKARIEFGPSC